MNETKGALSSVGVYGSVLSIVTGLTPILEQLQVVQAQLIPNAVLAITGLLGGLISLWGRLRAKKKISRL